MRHKVAETRWNHDFTIHGEFLAFIDAVIWIDGRSDEGHFAANGIEACS